MKKHRDLLSVLRANKMRITLGRRLLLQFILDNKARYLSLKEIQVFSNERLIGVDRSSIYRNLQTFKKLDIIQELNLPKQGKRFQYVFDRKVHHFYICKACGKSNQGKEKLFQKIEKALNEIPDFSKANLSALFYGYCGRCYGKRNGS
ncbi:transcriptional repressor [Candidatus Nomurabacteria bacterium]|nr:transcriptional repressor [Candidatus Nomurabacteria bacterium]